MQLRKSENRGFADHGWLKARHSFSFAGYLDRRFMGHGVLRVMNEDRIAPGQGFGEHPHNDMEIITFVLSGQLEHKDSLGNGSIIEAGEFQRMSAGTGVTHSEFNPSPSNETHLYQIWIQPEAKGLSQGYEQKKMTDFTREEGVALIASRDGREGSMTIQQQAEVFHVLFDEKQKAELATTRERTWVQLMQGEALVNGVRLEAGDGAAFDEPVHLELSATLPNTQLLVFDVPAYHQ